MDGSDGSARPTTVDNSSLARKKRISKKESKGTKAVQSPSCSTARIGANSGTSGCIKGSGHKQGNRGQSFEHGQHQDNIPCRSQTVSSKDGSTSVAGSKEINVACDATEAESRRSIAATSTNGTRARSLTDCVREESIGTSPQTPGQATAVISHAVPMIGESDDTQAAYTVGRTPVPRRLLPILNKIVDDVTFFKLAIGLTSGGDLADSLKQSAWQRVQDEWKKAERKKAQHGTVAATEFELSLTEEFDKSVGF